MSYTVLARKYRSRTFDDLVGQEAIATTLKNAITAQRVHHGYLFTGTRGVGKTSTARVLAKSLNCLKFDAPTTQPCCECESCTMTAEGEDIDVIEIDAASNTGVDNIRDLRNNTIYRPARSRFKIYIIDEVHMLSTGAFNALLKTLEEPPGHVKFVLATTEIQKVPATIVSRCQRFDFRSISVDDIAGHLGSVLEQEGVQADVAVIRRIARLANGSMRDALSLLDQLLSFGRGELTAEILDQVVPLVHDELVTEVVEHLANEEAAAALAGVERSLSSGQTIERFCEMTVEHLRTLMVLRICGAETELVDLPSTVRDRLVEQSQRFDAPTYVHMITLMEEVRRAVKSSSASRALVDAAVVRLAMARNFTDIRTLLSRLDREPGSTSASSGSSAPGKSSRRAAAESAGTQGAPAASRPQSGSPASAPSRGRRAQASARGSAAGATVHPADESRVRDDPKVRQAMELFDGTLNAVNRTGPAATEGGGDQPDGAAECAPTNGDD